MSKYLAISLMIIMLVIGIVGGYAFSSRAPVSDSMSASKLAPSGESQSYSDQEYLEAMIAHHEDAIEMSKRVLEHTSRKEVTTLATNIIEAQSGEIERMKAWLEEWK